MEKRFRYGDVVGSASSPQKRISYTRLTPPPQHDEQGRPLPYRPSRLRLRPLDIYRLLRPYIQTRLLEQLWALLPLVIYLILFQVYLLHADIKQPLSVLGGLAAVVVGLMFFMEGLKRGLMPFGENIGNTLPRKLPLSGVLFIAFLLGVGVTLAEPAIGALKTAGSIVAVERSPYLYLLLNQWSSALVLVVGVGVGLAAIVATLRLIRSWSLKPLIFATLPPTLLLSAYMSSDPRLASIIGLAWDCGAVTTGPVTVPLVLALGIGVASATGKANQALAGFGLVTLASLFPILAVLLLGLVAAHSVPAEAIIQAAREGAGGEQAAVWYLTSPYNELIAGLRAIVPLVAFLFIVMLLVLRERVHDLGVTAYGISLSVIGIIIFNLGLTHGLGELGSQAGAVIPAAFQAHPAVEGSPLYPWLGLGYFIVFAFAWFLGFGATLAEPALHAVGMTVENLTQGAFKKKLLIYVVSFGVACGISLGVLQLIYDWPLAYLLLGGYFLALALTLLAREEFVNIAWDSAGVTTGPVTVPLVMAMGLGLGSALHRESGFGILALASIGPIISVLATGLWISWQVRRSHQPHPPVAPAQPFPLEDTSNGQ